MKKFLALLLHFSITCVVNSCTNGEIRIHGVHSDPVLAGRVDLCYQSVWRAVCRQNWDRNDAKVVCRQFGFPPEGAQFCTSSCFGRNDSLPGLNNFMCSGNETRLADCTPGPNTQNRCNTIGVICFSSFVPSMIAATSTRELQTTSSMSSAPTTTLFQYRNSQDHHDNLTDNVTHVNHSEATSEVVEDVVCMDTVFAGAALGGVSLIVLLVLVGVVIGWVWTCHRNKPKSSRIPEYMYPNPSYTSSQKPHNTFRASLEKNPENALDGEERDYEMPQYEIVKGKDDADELVYYVVNDTTEDGRNITTIHSEESEEAAKGKLP